MVQWQRPACPPCENGVVRVVVGGGWGDGVDREAVCDVRVCICMCVIYACVCVFAVCAVCVCVCVCVCVLYVCPVRVYVGV